MRRIKGLAKRGVIERARGPAVRLILQMAVGIGSAIAMRRSMQTAVAERDEEIERRRVLARELEHRTKNNSAIVLSLLELQKRDATTPEVRQALTKATDRIHAFVGAFEHLAPDQGNEEPVLMEEYLSELVERVGKAAFSDDVEIVVSIAAITLPPKIAVPIGLFVNEALTNCSKYAFPEGREGRVDVRFAGTEAKWKLEVCDNGCGDQNSTAEGSRTGSGTQIMKAIAQQAGARQEINISGQGCTASLTKD